MRIDAVIPRADFIHSVAPDAVIVWSTRRRLMSRSAHDHIQYW
jgi:hypothetical protein